VNVDNTQEHTRDSERSDVNELLVVLLLQSDARSYSWQWLKIK